MFEILRISFFPSDSSIAIKTGGCFPSEGQATLADGNTIPMSQLAVGDHVMSMDQSGKLTVSPVIMFMHVNLKQRMTFYMLHTEHGYNVTLTPGHLMHASHSSLEDPSRATQVFASHVTPGQYVYISDKNHVIRASRVVDVTVLTSVGAYAPLTHEGTIVVNDVITSCYAMVSDPWLAHTWLSPVRMYNHISNILQPQQTFSLQRERPQEGVHWYVNILHNIGAFVLQKDMWFQP